MSCEQQTIFRNSQAGVNNDLTVLNNYSFENLLDDIAHVASFEVNRVTFEKWYYLADEINPRWENFVKSFSVARDEKNAIFKRRQEGPSSSEDLISSLDLGNPLHLQNSDFNANTIFSLKLNGTKNYRVWVVVMKLAINTRNKTGFLDGTCLKYTYVNSAPMSNQWERCNSIVLSWESLSDVKDAFAIVSREESHRGITSSSSSSVTKPQVSGFVAKSNTWTNNGNKTVDNNKKFGNSFNSSNNRCPNPILHCINYGKLGHTVDRCFDIIDYTLGYNKNLGPKPNGPRTFNANTVSSSNEKGSLLSSTNERMLKLMNLINEAPSGSVHANMAGIARLVLFTLNVSSDKLIWNRHPKDFPFGSLRTELEISKNILFIRQIKWRIWPQVEFVLALLLTKLMRASGVGGEENGLLLLNELLNINQWNCRGSSEGSEEAPICCEAGSDHRRPRVDPTLLNDFEMATDGNGDPPVPDLRTMEKLCQPTLNGWGGPIAPIAIQATNFGLKNDMIQQVQNSCQFHILSGDDANKHLDKFLHVTQSIKVNGVTDDALRLCLFPHSLTHHSTAWFDRLPRNSITTFEQMAKMFLRKYFPPSMVMKLRNEITNFCQHPDESLFEAWECYKLSIDRYPNHNMLPITQIDTFYNGLTLRHRDTINAAAEIVAIKAKMAEINKNLMKVLQINQQVKAVTHSCETCGGPHSYNDCPANFGQTQNVYAAGVYNQGGNSYQPQGNRNFLSYRLENYLGPPRFNQIQNRSNKNRNQENNHGNVQGNNQEKNQFFQGASHGQNPHPAYQAPGYQAPFHQALIPQPQVVTTTEFTNYMKANNAILKNMQMNMTSLTNFNLKLKNMFGQLIKMNAASSSGSGTLQVTPLLTEGRFESALKPNPKPSIPYPSRLHDQKLRDKANDQKDKFFQIFKDLDFNISFADALILMPKFGLTIKSLLTNKEKLFELARTPLNGHCSTVLLKSYQKSWGTLENFSSHLSRPELSPTYTTLELTDRSISHPIGVAEDIFVKVGTFHFLADFVVVDFDADPRVSLILGRSFLKTRRTLIDVYAEELTLRVGNKAIKFNIDQTSRYSTNYDAMSVNRIDLINVACEEYSQEVLGFSVSGNPTLATKPIVSTSSLTLTPFGDSDFLLEETDAFPVIDDETISPKINDSYYDSEGDILLLEEFFNDDPSSPPLPPQELKVVEPTNEKSSIDKPPVVELKDLPPHLEY
uniref:Reverse transcriptase domain-containing protein n=1 Tax=Tanacetum cinerariifolium TaxID=118510 RepID=A0A6L2M8V0_TANCI|nr:reverse transcriptase domain-containing protein [Tanacetum cinerariifolium]